MHAQTHSATTHGATTHGATHAPRQPTRAYAIRGSAKLALLLAFALAPWAAFAWFLQQLLH